MALPGRPERQRFPITVSFEGGEDIPILFANHIFVRGSSDGFLVSFAQSHGPYLLDATEEQMREMGVTAKIIARLLIPPSRMREMIDVLGRVLEASAGEVTDDKPSKE